MADASRSNALLGLINKAHNSNSHFILSICTVIVELEPSGYLANAVELLSPTCIYSSWSMNSERTDRTFVITRPNTPLSHSHLNRVSRVSNLLLFKG